MIKIRSIILILLHLFGIFFVPLTNALVESSWIKTTAWGSTLSGWFLVIKRVGGGIGSVGAYLGLLLLFCSFLFILPFIITGLAEIYYKTARGVRRSEVTKAILEETELEKSDSSDLPTVFRVTYTYCFQVGGKKYFNTGIFTDGWSSDMEEHEKILKEYPAGATLDVYYDPHDIENNAIDHWRTKHTVIEAVKFFFAAAAYVACSVLTGIPLYQFMISFNDFSFEMKIISIALLSVICVIFIFASKRYYLMTMQDE